VPAQVLAHRLDGSPRRGVLPAQPLRQRQVVDVSRASGLDHDGDVQELFADGRGRALTTPLGEIDLPPYGYRWIRLLQ
jgi:hypothetical protein